MTIWSDGLDAIYNSELATDGLLSSGTGGDAVTLRMLDKTVGVAVGDPNEPSIMTILPAVCVRASELEERAIPVASVDAGTVTVAGREWRVKSHQVRPRPDGAQEVYLFLMGDNV